MADPRDAPISQLRNSFARARRSSRIAAATAEGWGSCDRVNQRCKLHPRHCSTFDFHADMHLSHFTRLHGVLVPALHSNDACNARTEHPWEHRIQTAVAHVGVTSQSHDLAMS